MSGGWLDPRYDCSTCKKDGYYKNRNCTKYFPEDIKDDPPDCYQAIHRTVPRGNAYHSGVMSEECPVSAITSESLNLIQIDVRQRNAKESTGASLYGPVLAKWPSKLVDAIVILEQCRNSIENGKVLADQ